MKLAIFDFDGTIFPFDTFPFLYSQWKKQKRSKIRFYKGLALFMPLYFLCKVKLYPTEKMKREAVFALGSLFNGLDMKQIEEFFDKAYMDMRERVDVNMVKEIEKCKEEGFHLVLVSGSLTPILDRAAREHKFNDVIGTELTMMGDRAYFHKDFKYIQGEEKAIAVVKKYKECEIDWKKSRAYADSFSDIDIMEIVGEPAAVRPDKDLLDVARDRKWRIIL